MDDHDRELQRAFDGQAARFEAAPVQSDPQALARLVAFARLPAGARLIDAGCGPGLVAEAFLDAGFTRPRRRPLRRDAAAGAPALRAVRRPRLVRSRLGVRGAPANGHSTPRCRDSSCTTFAIPSRSSAPGGAGPQGRGGRRLGPRHRSGRRRRRLAPFHRARPRSDACGESHFRSAGRRAVAGRASSKWSSIEEPFELDFDEWFDRGTPGAAKAEVRARILSGRARGFDPVQRRDGGITLRCVRVLARGVRAD